MEYRTEKSDMVSIIVVMMEDTLFHLPAELGRLIVIACADQLTINILGLVSHAALAFLQAQKLSSPQNLKYLTAVALAAHHGYRALFDWIRGFRPISPANETTIISEAISGDQPVTLFWLRAVIPNMNSKIEAIMKRRAKLGTHASKEMALSIRALNPEIACLEFIHRPEHFFLYQIEETADES
jgi:hypothetical protein